MEVTKNYHASNSTQKDNSFNLGRMPVLSDDTVDHDTGGWGETYTFTVVFTDADYNTNNISLWKSYDDNNWILVNSTTKSGVSVPVQFKHKFACEDYLSQSPYFYFKFRTVDEFNHSVETASQNITLEGDNVTISIASVFSMLTKLLSSY